MHTEICHTVLTFSSVPFKMTETKKLGSNVVEVMEHQ